MAGFVHPGSRFLFVMVLILGGGHHCFDLNSSFHRCQWPLPAPPNVGSGSQRIAIHRGRVATFAMASVWVKRELDSVVPRSVIATFAGMRYAIAVHCPRTNRRLPRDRRENEIAAVTSCPTRVRCEITRAHRRGGRSPTDGRRMVACAWPVR